MKKKASVISLIIVLFLTSMLAVANAQTTTESCEKSFAVGAGVFIHQEAGETHTHYFDFSVTDTNIRNNPQGTFHIVCMHGKEIVMIIRSNEITSFNVESVTGGKMAMFTGSATVKMDNGPWEEGWTFTVTALDLNGRNNDAIGITLLNPQGEVHCTVEPVPIAFGNIIIKN